LRGVLGLLEGGFRIVGGVEGGFREVYGAVGGKTSRFCEIFHVQLAIQRNY